MFATHGADALAAENDPNFTFRRVAPPPSGATRLITVQIDIAPTLALDEEPNGDQSLDQALAGIEPLGPIAEVAGELDNELFWANLPPNQGPERLAQAAMLLRAHMAEGAAVSGASMRRIGLRYGSAITKATSGKRVSPALVLAVISVESAGRSDAVSHAGAAGLMQLMPATAARFGVRDRLDPAESIRGGVAYLAWLLDEFDGDALLALAGYNAGENAVRRYGGVPPYAETRAYVPKVVAAWHAASGLCTTRQESAADTCDWNQYAVVEP